MLKPEYLIKTNKEYYQWVTKGDTFFKFSLFSFSNAMLWRHLNRLGIKESKNH
ncbi:hypothetical protein [Seonamhaeicola sp. ML3]|uniref:hypothetical protein n=1 Tax=Seonamhaeicola sp. ML3 TaxID=2937786 RepID=UPI00200C4970|nr:hypothetical protein [Seonamhaeicola sp. ML3]